MVLPEALSIVLLRKHNAETNWHMQLLACVYAVVGLPVILFSADCRLRTAYRQIAARFQLHHELVYRSWYKVATM